MKVITLIMYDLKNYCYSKKALIFMLILPVMIIIAASQIATALFVNHNFMEPITLVITDREQSFYTNFFIQKVREAPSLQENMNIIQTSEEEGNSMLEQNEAAGMVIIPEDFTSSMEKGIFKPIIVIGNHKKPLQATMIKEGMESATHLMSAAQSAVFTICDYAREYQLAEDEFDNIFKKAAMSFSLKGLGRGKIFTQSIKTPWMDMQPMHFYFVSILILCISVFGLQGMYLYINEKQNKLTSRVRTLGIPIYQLVFAKWVSLTIFLFMESSIVLWICKIIQLFEMNSQIGLAILSLLIICSCISSLVLLISSLSKNEYIGSIIIFSTSILGAIIGGGIIPYSYMPNFMEKIGRLTINYWGIQGLIYSLFGDQNDKVWQSICVISLLTIVCLGCILIKLVREEKRA